MSDPKTPPNPEAEGTGTTDPAGSGQPTPEGSKPLSEEDPALDEAVGVDEAFRSDAGDEPVIEDVSLPELEPSVVDAAPGGIDRIMDVGLTVSVELGRRDMLVQEVLGLGQGSVLDLKKGSSELVDILVNGKLLAQGEVVVIDENFGVRITSLVDPVERVKRMG